MLFPFRFVGLLRVRLVVRLPLRVDSYRVDDVASLRRVASRVAGTEIAFAGRLIPVDPPFAASFTHIFAAIISVRFQIRCRRKHL